MKKKIKLIVSDLHLGIGRFLEDGTNNPLEEFYFDEKFVEFLEFHTKGKYVDYDVEIILNGDIFNFLQVPFREHFLTVITETITLDVLKKIIDGHPKFFDALKRFAAQENRQITYIVGNHDQGMLWPAVRTYLDEVLQTHVKYKNIVYSFDGVHIEHGHMHEVANRLDPKKFFLKKDLPEPILNLPFGSHFFVEFVLKIKQKHPEVDKIRPFHRMMRWALINEFWFTVSVSFKLILYFIKSAFVSDSRKSWPFKRILKIFLEKAVFPDLSGAAKKIMQNERVSMVIFGHTHVYQYRQFKKDKEYFNTGTWTELTSLDISSLGRITKLTYVLLEYDDEHVRPRGRLKEWYGYHRIEEDVAIS
jgi:UDP-2,3-diacylglucosamine pyrophosphatase LpxH